MAGSQAGFSASAFRDAVHFAMNMGAPVDVKERVTFRWRAGKTFSVADGSNRPYDFSHRPVAVDAKADVQVPAAVQFQRSASAGADGGGAGLFNVNRAVLTLLDEDYVQVEGADQVLIGSDVYVIDFVLPQGLFDVTVYEVHCRAFDES